MTTEPQWTRVRLQPCYRCGTPDTDWGQTIVLHDPGGQQPPQERQFCDGCAHTMMPLGEAVSLLGYDPVQTGLSDAALAGRVTLHMAMQLAVERTNPGGEDPRDR